MQINRLFEIIYLLLNKSVITAKELSMHFEVSTRTIYRDIEKLSGAGIPVYMTKGNGGGISLLPEFVLNKAVLTDSEKTNILSALHAIEAVNLQDTDNAIKKLSSLFGKTSEDWVEVDFSAWANAGDEPIIFNTLKSCILNKKVVKFEYYSSNGASKRKVEPLKLCFRWQNWYLYAFCNNRKDFRFFKLRRIKNLETSTEEFEKSAPPKVFTEDNIFNDKFVTVSLRLTKNVAFRVYDEFINYEKLDNGDFMATLTMPSGDFLYQYVASFGEFCEVLSPENIRIEIKNKLQKTLMNYI